MENIKCLEDLILDNEKAFYSSDGPGVYPWEVPANTAYDLCCGDLSVSLFLQTRSKVSSARFIITAASKH